MDSTEAMVVAGLAASTMAKDEELLRLLYKDSTQPGVRQAGKAIATVLGLANTVLLPVKMINGMAQALYKSHMERFRKGLEEVPEEKIVEVAPEIGVPIFEKLGKTSNESISEMYINLLTRASHIDFANQAHPRFVSVIESLTRDEVTILNTFKASNDILSITIISNLFFNHSGQRLHGVSYPVINGTVFHKPGLLSLPENASFYFDNLRGLGLITEHVGSNRFPTFGDAYADLKKAFEAETVPGEFHDETIMVTEGRFEATPFCRLFLQACDALPVDNNVPSQ